MLLSLMVMVVVVKTCPDGHLLIVLKSGAEKCVPRPKREAKTCPDGHLLIVLKSGAEKCVPEEKERHQMPQWSTRKIEVTIFFASLHGIAKDKGWSPICPFEAGLVQTKLNQIKLVYFQ